ncbi:oligosaccharide flippase family protein [Sneathiella marina]|uniref:Oligosaccharide flippase family protein n=1 Tax=Sneathiella marina TaxID=2950108 RepID=A0ABY4W5Y6_9PROT|nr:oligosaccharide flippase family protein [Sneathiella marina]USG61307.1 oligosaccharide flippase family protein [Sneathiella marina]
MASNPRKALSWSFAMNMSSLGISGVMAFILAAILGPESFGIVAIAGIFVFFIQIVAGQFLSTVIIQRKDLQKGHLDTIFWVSIVWCLLMSVVAYSASGFWGKINNTPEVTNVIIAMAPLILLKGLTTLPLGMLVRAMDFKHLTYIHVIGGILGGLIGVYMALNGYGIWALVVQQWVGVVIFMTLAWFFNPYAVGFDISWKYLKDVLPFAGGAFLNEMGGFAQSRMEAILVGILFGPILIALYRICDRLVDIVNSLLSRSIAVFILPYASQHQNDTAKLAQIVEKCIRLSAGLSFPILGVLGGMSSVVLEILGDEWAVAWLGLIMLCVVGAVQSFSILTPYLLQAIGKPGIGAALTWGTTCTSVVSFIVVAHFFRDEAVEYQLAALAGMRALVFVVINVPANFLLINWTVKFPPGYLSKLLFAPLSSFLAGLASGYVLLNYLIPESWDLFARFVLSGFGSGGIAIITLLLLDTYIFNIFTGILKTASNRFFSKGI